MKNKKSLAKSFIFFAALIVLTFWVIFKDQDIKQIINLIKSVKVEYILLGILAMCFYFSCEAFNVKGIFKAFGEKLSMGKSFKFTLISFFFSSITPAATGGQPMEIYYMHKEKYSTSYAITALLIQLCCFQFVTLTFGITSAVINFDILKGGLIYLFIFCVFINMVALVAMLICLFSQKLARKIIDILIKILEHFKYKKIDEAKEKLEAGLKKYTDGAEFIKKHKSIFLKTLFVVVLQMIAYYSVPYFVYRAFGFSQCSLIQLILLQALLYCSVSGLPLPGSVGVSEGAFLKIFSGVFAPGMVSSAMLLNRGINFYLFVIIGAVITMVNSLWLKKRQVSDN